MSQQGLRHPGRIVVHEVHADLFLLRAVLDNDRLRVAIHEVGPVADVDLSQKLLLLGLNPRVYDVFHLAYLGLRGSPQLDEGLRLDLIAQAHGLSVTRVEAHHAGDQLHSDVGVEVLRADGVCLFPRSDFFFGLDHEHQRRLVKFGLES